jgi:hypothetical protein
LFLQVYSCVNVKIISTIKTIKPVMIIINAKIV